MPVTFGPWRGDLTALRDMAIHAWRHEYGIESFPDLFDPAHVRFLAGPDLPPDHLLTAWDGDRPVGFVMGLPHTIRLHGTPHRAVASGLLTCRKEQLRQGVADALCREAVRLSATHGYALNLFFVESGHRSTALFRKMVAEGIPITWVRRNRVWGRILDLDRAAANVPLGPWERRALGLWAGEPPDPAGAPLRGWRLEDLPALADRLAAATAGCDLVRVMGPDELARTLGDPVPWPSAPSAPTTPARTLVLDGPDGPRGFVTWLMHNHLGPVDARWAWVQQLVLPDDAAGARALVGGMLRAARAEGCVGALAWDFGYHRRWPLLQAGFVPYPRAVDLLCWTIAKGIEVGRVRSVFMHEI